MTKITMQDRLRVDTAKWLKISIETMTPAQEVKLDRCCVLRLQIEDMMARQLAVPEAPFDAAKYILISEALERLVADPEQSKESIDLFAGAKQELLVFLEARADKLQYKAERERTAALEPVPQVASPELPVQVRDPVELLAEVQDPPTSNAHVTYVDAGVLDDQQQPSPLRTHSLNNAGGTVTPAAPRPSSPVTAAFFGKAPCSTGLGNNPWATRDWSPRRGF